MEQPLKPAASAWRWRFGLLALALICSAAFTQVSIFSWADLQFHDWLTRSLPQKPPPPQLTVIDIDTGAAPTLFTDLLLTLDICEK